MKSSTPVVLGVILFLVAVLYILVGTEAGQRHALEAELKNRVKHGDMQAKRELALFYIDSPKNEEGWQIVQNMETEGDLWARHMMVPERSERYQLEQVEIPVWEYRFRLYKDLADEGYREAYDDILRMLYLAAYEMGAPDNIGLLGRYEYWASRSARLLRDATDKETQNLHTHYANLASLYEDAGVFDKALYWHDKAAPRNNLYLSESMLRVLSFHYFGVGTERNPALAADYVRAFGYAYSLPFLGKFYINGELTGQSEPVRGCPMIYAALAFPALRLNLAQYKAYCDENTAEEQAYIASVAEGYIETMQKELENETAVWSVFNASPATDRCIDNYENDCAAVWARAYLEAGANGHPDYDSALILYRIYKLWSAKQELEQNEIAALEGIIAYREGDIAKAQEYLEISAVRQNAASHITRDLLGKIYYAQGYREEGCAWSFLADYDPRSILRCKESLPEIELANARQYAAEIIKSGSNVGRWMFP